MNTEALTQSVPNLDGHLQDLRRSALNVGQDLKSHADTKLQDVKAKADGHLQDARSRAAELLSTARDFATEHPFAAFGLGVLAGVVIAARRRK